MCRPGTPEVMVSPVAILSRLVRSPYASNDNRSEQSGQIRGFLGGIPYQTIGNIVNHKGNLEALLRPVKILKKKEYQRLYS